MDVDERLRRAGEEWRNTVSAPFEKAQLAREWTVSVRSGTGQRLMPLATAALVIAIAAITAAVLRPAHPRATHPITTPPSSSSSRAPGSTSPINAPIADCTLTALTTERAQATGAPPRHSPAAPPRAAQRRPARPESKPPRSQPQNTTKA